MITFIINPSSGGGSSLKIWSSIEPYLIRKKVEYEVFVSRYKGEAKEITSKICKELKDGEIDRIVVAVGGDGTVNDMLEGIDTSKDILYANIPAGTGNDLCRGLGMPKSAKLILKRIIEKKNIKNIDYGVISFDQNEPKHKRFLVSAGIGFDASVTKSYTQVKKEKFYARGILRKLLYIIMGIKEFFVYKNRKASIELEGVKKQECNNFVFLSSHIHPYEGGGIEFAKDAKNDDGKLSLCLVNKKNKFAIAKILISAFFGKHTKYYGVMSYDVKDVSIRLDRPSPIHVDGEFCGEHSEVFLSCVAGKIKFIC